MPSSEIQIILSKSSPTTVRRVLPREFVEHHVKQHLQAMEHMMKSFQAILTFPTSTREMPALTLRKMQQQFDNDLLVNGSKMEVEVDNILMAIENKEILQANIMLNVISETPFPFCVLNTIDFSFKAQKSVEKIFVSCYVILWAQQAKKDESIHVWAKLAPKYPRDEGRIPKELLKSDIYMVRFPADEIYFHAFNTAISVVLHNVPTELDALAKGKSLKAMINDLKHTRKSLLRQEGQKGNFLHVIWGLLKSEEPDYVPINELDVFGNLHKSKRVE